MPIDVALSSPLKIPVTWTGRNASEKGGNLAGGEAALELRYLKLKAREVAAV